MQKTPWERFGFDYRKGNLPRSMSQFRKQLKKESCEPISMDQKENKQHVDPLTDFRQNAYWEECKKLTLYILSLLNKKTFPSNLKKIISCSPTQYKEFLEKVSQNQHYSLQVYEDLPLHKKNSQLSELDTLKEVIKHLMQTRKLCCPFWSQEKYKFPYPLEPETPLAYTDHVAFDTGY